jgi:hypothetical protein
LYHGGWADFDRRDRDNPRARQHAANPSQDRRAGGYRGGEAEVENKSQL